MFSKILSFIGVLIVLIAVSGCSLVTEVSKTFWGSSTRLLEKARVNALSETFQCSIDECFDAVLAIAGEEQKIVVTLNKDVNFNQNVNNNVYQDRTFERSLERKNEGKVKNKLEVKHRFDVFIKSRVKQHIVVLGIPGNVDTTEVGIFFDETGGDVKIEISSLSTSAKRTVAKAIFEGLSLQFTKVNK